MEQYKGRNPLEEGIRKAFEKAEILPSPEVWENIEKNLGSGGNGSKRTGLIILQIAAAVALVFASSLALLNYFANPEPVFERSAGTESTEPIQGKAQENSVLPGKKETKQNGVGIVDSKSPVVQNDSQQKKPESIIVINENVKNTKIAESNQVYISIPIQKMQWNLEIGAEEYLLDMTPFWFKKKEMAQRNNLWAKAGFGTGNTKISEGGITFIGASADAQAFEANYDPQRNFTADFAGNTYSMGFGAGKNIGRKWMIEGGLSYVVSRLNATSNSIELSDGKSYPVYYTPNFNGIVVITPAYDFNNTLKYISVPFNVGYNLVDRKVGWLLSTGIATNFLIGQSINSEQYDSFRMKSENSPFRPVTASAVIGTELYVNLGNFYQLSFSPKYNIGIMDITKPEAPFYLRPSYWNIGLSLRYMIK